jgi:endonuclease/exonuclease/phosphatase family metal-dependent hydrolase
VAWLEVDVLLVQEFKADVRARQNIAELERMIDGYTGGRWQTRLDDCPRTAGQHVGVLFDSKRVRAQHWQTFAALNPHGSACQDQLRPGFGAYFGFPGGLDLHVIGVHFKSGAQRRAFDLRQRSADGVVAAFRESNARAADSDAMIAGDFNTMGCTRCSPKVGAVEELAAFATRLESLSEPFRLVPASAACSHYFGARPTLLDHFAASARLNELPPGRQAQVLGDCADRECRALPKGERRGLVGERLSDHCPLVIELDDRDLD